MQDWISRLFRAGSKRISHILLQSFPPKSAIRFRCNVCGTKSYALAASFGREMPNCRCGSTVRLRSLIHLLSHEFFGKSMAIPDFPHRSDLVGIDMSGAPTYAERLAEKIGYTNTFLHKAPRLDITDPDPSWFERCDFVMTSDVFEHVAPPVSSAFDNSMKLLKPGGLLILTVPYTKTGETVEHFPELFDFRLEGTDGNRVLRNTRRDGTAEIFDRLVFHGGEGETLEMRVFSESGVLAELRRAGFHDIRIWGDDDPEFGIFWKDDWSLPITARKPARSEQA
jgi:SAM-dependent methyltransferase